MLTHPIAKHLRTRIPKGYRLIQPGEDGNAYVKKPAGALRVIESFAAELDGRWWQHLSCSRLERLPSWTDLRDTKAAFVGPDREAYVVLPPETSYVNQHPHVLHVWACLDEPAGRILPDFTRGLGTI